MGCGPSHCQKELCLIQNTDIFKDECKFFCPFWRLHLPFQPPQSTYLCTFTKKYIILASLVLPPNLATLRNHLVHPVDQISSGYSVSFLQVTSTIIHQTSTYHSVSRKEMENVYFFVCTSEIFLWLNQKHNDYMGLIQTAKIHVSGYTPSLQLGSPGLSSSQFFSPPPTSSMTIYVVVTSFLNKL
jgi:hypothetical protein